jgi:cold shock CspA family protein
MTKQLGILNFWNDRKGFGFLRHAVITESGEIVRVNNPKIADVFVHVKQLQAAGIMDVDEGDAFHFDVGPDPRSGKSCAIDLELVKKNDEANS